MTPVLRIAAPPLVSAVLLSLCFFPANAGFLAWVALVPLLSLVRLDAPATRPRLWHAGLYLACWVAGMAFFAPVLLWMPVADDRMYATWAALTLYCGAYWPLTVWLLRRLDRGTPLPLVVTLPAVWVALEYARAHLLTGFAWYYLAHTQHNVLLLIQVSDLGGAYAVSAVVAAVNAVAFEWLWAASGGTGVTVRSRWLQTGAVAGVVGACLAYGGWQLARSEPRLGPTVALLQGNLDQRLRNAEGSSRKSLVGEYSTLLQRVRASGVPVDLVIWPETSFVAGWPVFDGEGATDKELAEWRSWRNSTQAAASPVARELDAELLLGLNAYQLYAGGREKRFNAALRVTRDGEVPGDRYDKIHCVPFGEYVPLRDTLPWMKTFAPYDYDYSITPGTSFTRFGLDTRDGRRFTYGAVICYEDTDPVLARQYVAPGTGRVDFLVNLSNDGWFDGSAEHEQHLAISRFRAVECRRALVRAVNMGVSAVIDADGHILALPDGSATWSAAKKMSGVVMAEVPLDGRSSLYARLGDWLPQACGVLVLAGLLWGRKRKS
jgi:apolipoprotein N-acyltransferase